MIMKSISRCLSLLLISTLGHAAVPGVTPGEFSVDASGSANHQIPIAVPPGTAGMQPSLSLSYNSRSGNGVLGVGWTLGGLSVITRCPATKAVDGFIDGIDFDSNDRFCIDGQRLIQITGTAGQYGDDGIEYRTELDGFTKVISYGVSSNGPDYFRVWTKSGQILEYGNTTDSRIEAQGKTSVRLWAVNKISDTVGNYLTVTYNEDATNGSYIPTRIDYTGNDSAALAPHASVQFSYATRADIPTLYFAGSLTKNAQRLTNIRTYAGTTMVKDYQLTYDNEGSANFSHIISITECDGQISQQCFKPISFEWAQNNTGFHYSQDYVLPQIINDYLLTDNPNRSFFQDLNGDGLVDLAESFRDSNGNIYNRAWLNTGTGWVQSQDYVLPQIINDYELADNPVRSFFQDLNGDGLVDLAESFRDSNGNIYNRAWLNTGAGWVQSQDYVLPQIINDYELADNPVRSFFQDLNGDGLVDLAESFRDSNGNIYNRAWLNTGAGWVQSQDYVLPQIINDYLLTDNPVRSFFQDLNGDGLVDLAESFRESTGVVYNRAWLNTGAGWVQSQDYVLPQIINDYLLADNPERSFFLDLNGDGLVDLAESFRDSNGNVYNQAWLNNSINSNALVNFVSSVGISTNLALSPITDSSVYTKGTGSVYPEVDIQAPIYVVSSIKVDDGLGGQRETTYRYGSAKSSYERGFLGFASMSASDVSTGITTTTSYNQTYPYIGLVNHTEQIWNAGTPGDNSDDALLGEVDTTFTNNQTHIGIEVAPSHPGVLFPYASQVIKHDYEIN